MIGRITGTLLEKMAQQVLVDCGGIGYEVQVPMGTVFQLPEPGSRVTLHTHLVVREDAHLLYGFASEKERGLFRILIKLNGVGPRLALTILSGIEANDFVACVHNNDVNALVRLPGVGRKTAERLVMEVKDRLKEWDVDAAPGADFAGAASTGNVSLAMQEAEGALISLGYKPQEAARAVKQAAKQLDEEGREAGSEALIRLALKNMG